jgi:hypothetical protein
MLNIKADFSDVINFFSNMQAKINNMKKKRNASEELSPSRNRVSKTDKAARHEARYRAVREGRKFDESDVPEEEITGVEEEMADRFARDIADNILR